MQNKIWQVIDTTSSAMTEYKTVIDSFKSLDDAIRLAETDDRFRVRQEPAKRFNPA